MTDPATKQKHTCRQDFKHAIRSREALDICPKWMRACDGHDVNLPLRIMSYVKVPAGAELGVVWHKTNLTKGGYRNVIKHGLKKTHGGRHRIFGDGFWKNKNQWPWGLTGEGSTFHCPDTGRLVCIDTPYGFQNEKKCRPDEKTYWFAVDWRAQKKDQVEDLFYNTTNHSMMFANDVHAKYLLMSMYEGGPGMTVHQRVRFFQVLAAAEQQRLTWELARQYDEVTDGNDFPKCNFIERKPEPNETAPGSEGNVVSTHDAAVLVMQDDIEFRPVYGAKVTRQTTR